MIAVDIEAYDPNLHTLGPGAMRKDGFVAMVGLYDGKDYVCCRQDDPRLSDWLASDEDKIFHNGVYDLAWLVGDCGFKVGGTWHDTMTRCALIDEFMDLDLDTCCKKFNVKGKNYEDTIEKWFETYKKIYNIRGTVWSNLPLIYIDPEGWSAMAKYNKQDCIATYNLFMATEPEINTLYRQHYDLECTLYPVWLRMYTQGVKVDLLRMERLHHELNRLKARAEAELYHEYGLNLEILASNKQLTEAMHKLGIHSPRRTEAGKESWSKEALPLIDHPCIKGISNLNNLEHVTGKKGIGKLKQCLVGDRLHTVFKPTKRDDGGTITFRLASASPNLQNLPSREEAYREKAWGPEVRSLFIPEDGQMLAATDYGQIEFRIMAHFCVGKDQQWLRDQCKDPNVDMHKLAMERTGINSRYIIKRINFGVPYGMGIKKMVNLDYPMFKDAAMKAGSPHADFDDVLGYGQKVMNQFKQGFPALFDMIDYIETTVRTQGYINTLSNRRVHRPRAEQDQYGRWNIPYYRCVARTIQGSAADTLKQGMCNALRAGVFDVLTPHLSVHDETVVSVPFNKEGTVALRELEQCMRNAFKDKLTVPLTVATEVGPNWGYWAKDIWEEMQQGVYDQSAFKRVYAPEVHRDLWCVLNGYTGLDGLLNVVA